MPNGKKKPDQSIDLTITAELVEAEREEKRPQAFAYAFSSSGRLLARERLDPQGKAKLTFSGSLEAQEVRVLVGPEAIEEEDLDEEDDKLLEGQTVERRQKIRAADLLRRGGVEKLLRIDPTDLRPNIRIPVFPDSWRCWLLSRCLVRGTLLKRVGHNDLPICNATVEIYEVDPISVILPRLPDVEIERIRDFIVNPPPPPPPPDFLKSKLTRIFPPPPPPEQSLEAELPPLPSQSSFALQAMQSQRALRSGVASLVTASAREIKNVASPTSASTELQSLALTARDTFQFKQALLNSTLSIQHLLCLVHPTFVTMRRIALVRTDRCGHFQTFIFRGCHNPDAPDLYFKARQRLFSFLPPVYIYAPTPVACYTRWNYVCGTEVTLYATNPAARACAPCPDDNIPEKGVVVKAIGNILLNQVFGTSTTSPTPVTTNNRGLLHDGRPWGGILRFRFDFDPALRDNNIKYYQVSQRRGTSGGWTPLLREIHRHYTTFGPTPSEVLYPIGPQPVGTTPNLFEIPPTLPPVPGMTAIWTIRDLFEDTIHAKFYSEEAAPGQPEALPDQSGKFQIKIDLYDGAGALVNIDTQGVTYYVPTATDPAPAAPLGLVIDDDGDGNKSFIMTVHVDNNPCVAEIMPPVLNGTPAGGCGILEYTGTPPSGNVTMTYRAFHRNRFANYEFSVVRGVTLLTIPGEPAGYEQVPPSPGTRTASATAAALLGGCPAAGFVETLDVDGTATDGISGILHSAFTVRAFALAPQGILAAPAGGGGA